jgi:hypothetical protein
LPSSGGRAMSEPPIFCGENRISEIGWFIRNGGLFWLTVLEAGKSRSTTMASVGPPDASTNARKGKGKRTLHLMGPTTGGSIAL